MNENMKVKWFDEEIEVYDEKRVVSKSTSTITLNYIPSKTRPLTVENKGVMLTETEGTPSENQYVADRENGLLLFNSVMNGKVMVINYAAVGQWCINAEKVYTNTDNKGNVIETLEELIEENRSAIESIKTIGDGAKVVQEMQGAIDSVTGLVGNIIEGENINNTLVSTISTARTTNSNLTNATIVATNKINEMNTWVNSHGDIVDLDNRVENLDLSYNKIANEDIPKINSSLETKASKTDVARLSSGTPLFANSIIEMTDITKNYVNITDGYLYVSNGTNFIKSTLKYQEVGLSDQQVKPIKTNFFEVNIKNLITLNADTVKIERGYPKFNFIDDGFIVEPYLGAWGLWVEINNLVVGNTYTIKFDMNNITNIRLYQDNKTTTFYNSNTGINKNTFVAPTTKIFLRIYSEIQTGSTCNYIKAYEGNQLAIDEKWKIKDEYINQSININESENNASTYGFLPTNNGDDNAKAIRKALENKGTIIVDKQGVYELSETIVLEDNTEIIFGENTYIKRVKAQDGTQKMSYVFINKGAYDGTGNTRNKNIKIRGLKLITNAQEIHLGQVVFFGLRGQLSFWHIDNLEITDYECLDLGTASYNLHICDFNDLLIDKIKVYGGKDAIHLGCGKRFSIKNGIFRTYDDPIALNAHDYVTGTPQLGWIEDGVIERCWDLNDSSTTGFFARLLGGSWLEWFSGMEVQLGDTVVADGKLYRVREVIGSQVTNSTVKPVHDSGSVIYETTIKWIRLIGSPILNCGCKNIHFKNINLQKNRPNAFSLHFDKDSYSRSYYPNSIAPIQSNITLDNIIVSANVGNLLVARTPFKNLKILNSELGNQGLLLNNINTEGIIYNDSTINMGGNIYNSNVDYDLIVLENRNAKLNAYGSIKENNVNIKTEGVFIVNKDI